MIIYVYRYVAYTVPYMPTYIHYITFRCIALHYKPMMILHNKHTYIHPCMHACMDSFIHSINHLFIYSFIHSFIHSFTHTCIHTYIHIYINDITHETDGWLRSSRSIFHPWMKPIPGMGATRASLRAEVVLAYQLVAQNQDI